MKTYNITIESKSGHEAATFQVLANNIREAKGRAQFHKRVMASAGELDGYSARELHTVVRLDRNAD